MKKKSACCCGDSCCAEEDQQATDASDGLETPAGRIPLVTTGPAAFDRWGALRVRLGIGRDSYTVEPGLYGAGNPDAQSPVLATSNYRLSFNHLRRAIAGIDAWILVLDTGGINVWCAAGKGTFCTEELLHRIQTTGLDQVVTHRTLILPQLGAPGISAHEVTKQSGYRVVYGPVRAADIPDFLRAGMQATAAMRRVEFTLLDRLTLVPVEFANFARPLLYVMGTLLIASLLGVAAVAWREAATYLGASLVGLMVVPALLPWIPGRAFAWKGWLAGLIYAAAILVATDSDWRQALIHAAILPVLSGWAALNFTGSSTYASRSGVAKEVRYALPLFSASVLAGLLFACLSRGGGI